MNSCAICLEPLSSNSAVGTCVPCGHCFHVECFDGWKAVGVSRSNKHSMKCPTCNTKTNHFCRLYLDFNNNDNDANNDDSSEDSIDSENENECFDESNDNEELESITALQGELQGRERSVVDLTGTCGSNGSRNKYKEKLRRLKDTYSRTNTQLTEIVEENRKLSKICGKNRVELSECTNLLQEKEVCRKSLQRAYESLHLECVRLKNKLEESIQKLTDEKDSNRKNNNELQKLKDSYQRDITRAQANSLKEVQGILEQHPKIVNENSTLREIIRRKEDEIEMLRRKSGLLKRSSDTINLSSSQNTKRALKLAQQFHAMADESHHQNTMIHVKKAARVEEASASVNPSIMSSHAARMSRACSTSRPIGPLTDASDILNGADRSQHHKRMKDNNISKQRMLQLNSSSNRHELRENIFRNQDNFFRKK